MSSPYFYYERNPPRGTYTAKRNMFIDDDTGSMTLTEIRMTSHDRRIE